jgi:hypothetical protein
VNVSKPGFTAKDFLGDTLLAMSSYSRRRRRGFGLVCLMVAGLMLFLGQTVLSSHLEGWGFILFWMAVFLFTGWAVIAALLDLRAVRKETLQEQRDILDELVEKIKREDASSTERSEQKRKQNENHSADQ